MKKILPVLIIAILGCMFIAYRNNNPQLIIAHLIKDNGYIDVGELRYKIYLLGVLPIGEAVFAADKVEEYKNQKVYHLSATAQSSKIFSKIFSGYALLDSYVHIGQFNPVLFKQRLRISGKQDIDKEIAYDQGGGVMTVGDVRRKIFSNTQDPLSALFNIRRMELDKNKKFEMNINSNQKNYVLKGNAIQQDISVDKRVYKIILAKASVSRRDNNPYHKSNITMVLLRQKGNIPILIKVFASGILINAKLIDIR